MTPIKNFDKYLVNGLDVKILEELLKNQNELVSIDEKVISIDEQIASLEREKNRLINSKPNLAASVQENIMNLYNPAKKINTIADIMSQDISSNVDTIDTENIIVEKEIEGEENIQNNVQNVVEKNENIEEEIQKENTPKIDFEKIQIKSEEKENSVGIDNMISKKLNTVLHRSSPHSQDESEVITFLSKCKTSDSSPTESMTRFATTPFIFLNMK